MITHLMASQYILRKTALKQATNMMFESCIRTASKFSKKNNLKLTHYSKLI